MHFESMFSIFYCSKMENIEWIEIRRQDISRSQDFCFFLNRSTTKSLYQTHEPRDQPELEILSEIFVRTLSSRDLLC